MTEISKRSKKEQREFYAKQRVTIPFNTGTRSMKTSKLPTRAMIKDADRKSREMDI